ncbi:MAG TPA: hypothetical protein VGL65_11915, partial [Gemmatimonadales bacterium]
MASTGAFHLRGLAVALLFGAAAPLAAQGPKELPLKYSGPATVPAITAGDLMTRLYKYADDSMGGRFVGSKYNLMATAYIESEVRTLGLKPAGDDGGYFQNIGVVARALDSASTLTVDGHTLHAGVDFLASAAGHPKQYSNTPVVFGGVVLDTMNMLTAEQVAGKVVLMMPFTPPPGFNAS